MPSRTQDDSRTNEAFEFVGVSKSFGEHRVLADISLRVDHGETVGFVGLNGAGKSTTMRILLGLVSPSAGMVTALGRPVHPAGKRTALVGALIDRPGLHQHLSAKDNLRVFAHMQRMDAGPAARGIDRVMRDLGLHQYGRRPLGRFSTGMRQRVGIGTAFLGDPKLVVLDEPTEGLDPEGVVAVREMIQARAAEGVTIFLSSHRLGEVETLADRVVVIHEGRIRADAPPADLRPHRYVIARFDSADDSARATATLRMSGRSTDNDGLDDCVVTIDADDGSAILRELASVGVFPAELRIAAPSLEDAFLEIARTVSSPDV